MIWGRCETDGHGFGGVGVESVDDVVSRTGDDARYRRPEAYARNVGRQGATLRQTRIHTGRVRHVERAIVSPDAQDRLQIGEGVLREKVCALPIGLLRRVRDRLGAGKVEIRNREGMVRVVNIGRIIAHEVRRS